MVRVSAQDVSVNDHLDGLKEKFDLMIEEIDSLRKERDEYKGKGILIYYTVKAFHSVFAVDSQANELKSIRRNNVCLLCRDELSGAHLATQLQVIKARNIPGKSISSQPCSKQRLPKPSVDLSPRPSVVTSRIPHYRPQGHSAASDNGHTVTYKSTSTKFSSSEESSISPSRTLPIRPQIQSGTPTPASSRHMHHPTSPLSSRIIQPSRSIPLSPSLSMPPSSSAIMAECHHDESVDLNHNLRNELRVDMAHTLPHAHGVFCVKFSVDGKCLAVASRAKVFIYDLETGLLTW